MMYSQVTFGFFISGIIKELSFPDFFVPVIKSVLFGISIGLISCYQGLKVRSASTEVPQRTIRAVVDSLATVFLLDVLAALLNFLI
jgi:phospholipid/cholesterol/gamma-HCH transport system permease protein